MRLLQLKLFDSYALKDGHFPLSLHVSLGNLYHHKHSYICSVLIFNANGCMLKEIEITHQFLTQFSDNMQYEVVAELVNKSYMK